MAMAAQVVSYGRLLYNVQVTLKLYVLVLCLSIHEPHCLDGSLGAKSQRHTK
jgi:hypothetical protein